MKALLLALLFLVAQAQEPPPSEPGGAPSVEEAGIPGLPPGAPPPSPAETDRLTQRIGQGLRCPVCQGLSVADSTSSAAVLMKGRIRELVAQGYTQQEIDDYFVSKYGEWVLLDPTRGGLNRIVWIGPLLAAGLGLLVATTFLRGGRAEPAPAPRPAGNDPYVDRLLQEVDDDD